MCSEPLEAFSAPPLHHHYKLSASPAPLQPPPTPPLRLSPAVIVSPLSLIVTQLLRKTARNDEKSFSALCLCNFPARDRRHCFRISMVTHQRLSRQSNASSCCLSHQRATSPRTFSPSHRLQAIPPTLSLHRRAAELLSQSVQLTIRAAGVLILPSVPVIHPVDPLQTVVAGLSLVLHRHHCEVRHVGITLPCVSAAHSQL